jgi:hypothetical protein
MKKYKTILIVLFTISVFSQNKHVTNFESTINGDNFKFNSAIPESNILKVNNDEDVSYFKTMLSFISNYSYEGRTGAKTLPYLAPYFGYFDKSGFSISSSLYYGFAERQNKIEAIMFDVNYDHEFSNQLSLGAFANKTFYDNANNLMASSIIGYIGTYLDYDFNFVSLNIENSMLLSNKADLAFTPSLYKEITFLKNESLIITPTLLANFSSLNYYEEFNNNKINNNVTTVDVQTTVDNKKFTLLDYEFVMPIDYKINNLVLFLTPMIAFPMNTIYTTSVFTTYTANGVQIGEPVNKNSTDTAELNLKTKFFIEIGLYYKI